MRMAEDAMANNKMLHVVYRVGDMDAAVKFYTQAFGMQVLRQRDIPDEKYTNVFLGYGTEKEGKHFSIELTYNYGVSSYSIGTGFAGLGLGLPDLRSTGKKIEPAGGKLLDGPKDIEYGPSLVPDQEVKTKTVATVLKACDPDGYAFEVTEQARQDGVSKVCINVRNLDDSIKFYEEALGMTLLLKRSLVPLEAALIARLGYGSEQESTVVELRYRYAQEKLDMGTAYAQIAVGTPDVYAAAESIRDAGYAVTRDPGPVPGIGTKITACRDPDGYKIVLVDQADIEKELEED